MFERILKYSIGSDIIIYTFRCLIGFLLGYELYLLFPQYEIYWTLLSIILVIPPEAKDTKRLSLERFKSNLIGSSVGLIIFFLHIPKVLDMLIGIVLSIAICYRFNLMNVSRTAIVALIIVMIHEEEKSSATWQAPVERFVSVTIGCIIGYVITLSTSVLLNFIRKKTGIPTENI